jgi:SAM-dependent methyltransferase
MLFTSHNIRLPDGTCTRPEDPYILEDGGIFRAACRMLNFAFPDGLTGRTIADLGCLEGGYATGFARLGMVATGFEARESNMENCRYVQTRMGLDNLQFVKADVNDIHLYGPFDAIWACGILYHLRTPGEFMAKLSRICQRIVLLETHFTYAHLTPAAELYKLSELCEQEGLMGRWYKEFDEISVTEMEDLRWHSWSNTQSFWLQKEYLIDLIHRVGFNLVLEQYDQLAVPNILTGIDRYYRAMDRSLFVGIKI